MCEVKTVRNTSRNKKFKYLIVFAEFPNHRVNLIVLQCQVLDELLIGEDKHMIDVPYQDGRTQVSAGKHFFLLNGASIFPTLSEGKECVPGLHGSGNGQRQG